VHNLAVHGCFVSAALATSCHRDELRRLIIAAAADWKRQSSVVGLVYCSRKVSRSAFSG
jgi:hypothetical protein